MRTTIVAIAVLATSVACSNAPKRGEPDTRVGVAPASAGADRAAGGDAAGAGDAPATGAPAESDGACGPALVLRDAGRLAVVRVRDGVTLFVAPEGVHDLVVDAEGAHATWVSCSRTPEQGARARVSVVELGRGVVTVFDDVAPCPAELDGD